MKLRIRDLLVLLVAGLILTANVMAATPVNNIVKTNPDGSGNINDVYKAVPMLKDAIVMVNSMLQNNEITFSSPENEIKFNNAHQQMMKGYFLAKQFIATLGGKTLKGNKDAYLLIDESKNLLWDSYWAFNQMMFLNEIEFVHASGDYKFSRAHSKERTALELIKQYMYGES